MKRALILLGALALIFAFSGPAAADYTYVESLTVGNEYHWGLTQWTGNAASLEDAVTGASDYSYDAGTGTTTGDALGWQQGWGNMVLDFGEVLSGDLNITFWHFGGINWSGVENDLVYMYVSSDGVNWTPFHTDFDPDNTDGYGGRPRGTEGDVDLLDVMPGGETLYETTYNLYDTFGVDEIRYLMIEKIDGGAKTGKFIDAVGISPVPVPAAVWLLGSGLLGIIGTRRKRR
jgi:hypothetical protein